MHPNESRQTDGRMAPGAKPQADSIKNRIQIQQENKQQIYIDSRADKRKRCHALLKLLDSFAVTHLQNVSRFCCAF